MIEKIIKAREKLKVLTCSREKFLVLLTENGLFENKLIRSALEQSIISHFDQKRIGGGNYLEGHIFPVTSSVINYYKGQDQKINPKIISSALLHDAMEDDPLFQGAEGDKRFKDLFGKKVFDYVSILTKPDYKLFEGGNIKEKKKQRDEFYYSWLNMSPEEVKLIKFADRENNIFGAHEFEEERMRRYIEETEKFYLTSPEKIPKVYYRSIKNRVQKLKRLYLDKFDVIQHVFNYCKFRNITSHRDICREKNLLEDEAKAVIKDLEKDNRTYSSEKIIFKGNSVWPTQTSPVSESYSYFYKPADEKIELGGSK